MLKLYYNKPQIEIIEIRVESSIANGSVHPGPTIGQNNPDIDDFETTGPIYGIGDL